VTWQVNENARRPAVLHDIGPMSIKSLDYPELGILRAHEPTGPGFARHPCAVSRSSQVTASSNSGGATPAGHCRAPSRVSFSDQMGSGSVGSV